MARAAIHRTLSVSPLTHENNFALSYEGWVLSEKILMKIHDSLSHRWLPQQDSAVRVDSIPWQCRLAKVHKWDHQWLRARQPYTVAFNKPNTMLFGKYTTVCPLLQEGKYVECEIQWVRFWIPNYSCTLTASVQQPPVLVDQVQMWIQVAQMSQDTSDYSGLKLGMQQDGPIPMFKWQIQPITITEKHTCTWHCCCCSTSK